MLLVVILISFVCFLPVYSGRQDRLGIQPESHRRRSYKISHPLSFYDACLIYREEDSSVPFPRRNLCTFPVMFRMTPHHMAYITHTKGRHAPETQKILPFRFVPPKYRWVCNNSCVCFLPIHSGHQVRWTYQPGSHRRKVSQDFSSTFFLRCVP